MRSLILFVTIATSAYAQCDVPPQERSDCGYYGIDQNGCQQKGCCWGPLEEGLGDYPWCFYKSADNPCGELNFEASDPGFDNTGFVQAMMDKYNAQLNIGGGGQVVAAPDHNTPGGSYYYHWMRDGALSMWTYMQLNNGDYKTVKDDMNAYEMWVGRAQNQNDPNGIDVRIEPKFEIPSGTPYTGGWCRPQTDGPGLRALALATWAKIKLANGQESQVRAVTWPTIQRDLEWVLSNWQSNGCDLWEEVRSTDFFWGRMGYVESLNTAAELANALGDDSSASKYSNTASQIRQTLVNHWNGQYLMEENNRKVDGAVIHAIASFGSSTQYGPASDEAAKTIDYYNKVFCDEYSINQQDNQNGVPGILYGRYPGDSYAGGNPWQLLTAVLAETFYKGARVFRQKHYERRQAPAGVEHEHVAWKKLLGLGHEASLLDLHTASISAGDAVMTRLWRHVKDDNGRIDEQIDRQNGGQKSAQSLTWSYANVLRALHIRQNLTDSTPRWFK